MRSTKVLLLIPFALAGCVLETPDDNINGSTDGSIGSRTDGGQPGEDPPGEDPPPGMRPDAYVPDAAVDAAIYTCTAGNLNEIDPATGKCYMYFNTPRTQAAAKAACIALGGKSHLVSLTSRPEQDRVARMIAAADVWIGLTDAVVEGTWVWDSMEPYSFSYFAAGEPNGGLNSNCVVMKPTSLSLWADRACGDSNQYLCERDP